MNFFLVFRNREADGMGIKSEALTEIPARVFKVVAHFTVRFLLFPADVEVE